MKLAHRGGIGGRTLGFAIGFIAVCCAANLLAFTPDFPAEWVGNAASPSAYVSQYVDTEVNAQSGTKAEFEIEFAVVDQDHSVLDVRYDFTIKDKKDIVKAQLLALLCFIHLHYIYRNHLILHYYLFFLLKFQVVNQSLELRIRCSHLFQLHLLILQN